MVLCMLSFSLLWTILPSHACPAFQFFPIKFNTVLLAASAQRFAKEVQRKKKHKLKQTGDQQSKLKSRMHAEGRKWWFQTATRKSCILLHSVTLSPLTLGKWVNQPFRVWMETSGWLTTVFCILCLLNEGNRCEHCNMLRVLQYSRGTCWEASLH